MPILILLLLLCVNTTYADRITVDQDSLVLIITTEESVFAKLARDLFVSDPDKYHMVFMDSSSCSPCYVIGNTYDKYCWLPFGIRWAKDGPLVVNKIRILLFIDDKMFESKKIFFVRQTDNDIFWLTPPTVVPIGWKLPNKWSNWKGISGVCAFDKSVCSLLPHAQFKDAILELY
jgi:hypothetical protein